MEPLKIEHLCPEFIMKKIVVTHIPIFPAEDQCRWAFTKSGTFTLKSAYLWLMNKNGDVAKPNLPWNKIWKLKSS